MEEGRPASIYFRSCLHQMDWLVAALVVPLPLALSSICSAVCPMSKAAADGVKATPPPAAFAVVWPILFLGLGLALLRAGQKWPLVLLVCLLPLWQLLYSRRCGSKPRGAAWLLVACVASGLIGLGFAAAQRDHVSVVALAALVAWLIFAQQLLALELQVAV